MRCWRCKRHGELVTMIRYGDGTARCPKCGRTIRPKQRHEQPDCYKPEEKQNFDGAGYVIVGLILYGILWLKVGLWQLGMILWVIAGLIFLIAYLRYTGKL